MQPETDDIMEIVNNMYKEDPKLYQKCLDTANFAYWFNRLIIVARKLEDQL